MVLDEGLWAWLWDHDDGWAKLDPVKIAAELRAHGFVGVMPHGNTAMIAWLKGGAAKKFMAAGIAVCPSLSYVRTSTILAALSVNVGYLGGGRVMLDWEGWWDGKQALATQIVNDVMRAVPSANQRSTDCPWWAPLFYVSDDGKHHPTHPRAPTKEFGVLCAQDRYVQAYGAPEVGASTRMLAWSRTPTQYASLGNWAIRGAFQLYERTLNDVIHTTLREPTSCYWDWLAATPDVKKALRVVLALRNKGFVGDRAVVLYQQSAGLVVDDVVGSRTLASLGIK